MADIADKAGQVIEKELDAIIAAARGAKPEPRYYCRDCEEQLPEHRVQYGTCYTCQCAREMRIRRMGVGA